MAIILKFFGGIMHGTSASSESENRDEAAWAIARYALSHQGTIGRRFETILPAVSPIRNRERAESILGRADQMNHVYEIVERTEDDGDIVVRFKFVDQAV